MSPENSPAGAPRTDALHKEHVEMLAGVEALGRTAKTLPLVSVEEREILLRDNLQFLNEVLLPHAEAEEAILYPQWAQLVGFDGAPALLIAEHHEVKDGIRLLQEIPRNEVDPLQRALYGLQAVITSHFHKEEEFVLPAFEEQRADLTEQMLEQFEAAHQYAAPPSD